MQWNKVIPAHACLLNKPRQTQTPLYTCLIKINKIKIKNQSLNRVWLGFLNASKHIIANYLIYLSFKLIVMINLGVLKSNQIKLRPNILQATIYT